MKSVTHSNTDKRNCIQYYALNVFASFDSERTVRWYSRVAGFMHDASASLAAALSRKLTVRYNYHENSLNSGISWHSLGYLGLMGMI
jgi:hypothetical protein